MFQRGEFGHSCVAVVKLLIFTLKDENIEDVMRNRINHMVLDQKSHVFYDVLTRCVLSDGVPDDHYSSE